ncbi:MAG TPA: Zn-ribbon domain-containing OB-fold protein [Acidimicrobiales bacterium]|nr:Zn-ribbon domain-containing OB-fold protein [Acidimicrobiales bacterium]
MPGPDDAHLKMRMEPPAGPDSGPFWEATRAGVLLVQWCTACDKGIFYPRSFCPVCGATDTLQWRPASGRATVYAASVEHKPAATGSTFSGGEPYVIALVDLEEGIRMMTNVVGCAPAEVHPGQAVEVTWEPLSDGRQLPLFIPLGAPEPS